MYAGNAGIRIARDSFGKRGGAQSPRRFGNGRKKLFRIPVPASLILRSRHGFVPSCLAAGEAVVGDLDGMFKDFDGIEGIEQFGFADKG